MMKHERARNWTLLQQLPKRSSRQVEHGLPLCDGAIVSVTLRCQRVDFIANQPFVFQLLQSSAHAAKFIRESPKINLAVQIKEPHLFEIGLIGASGRGVLALHPDPAGAAFAATY